jgi:hypothetical protein
MAVGGEGEEGDSSGGHRGSTFLRLAASFCNIIGYQRKDAAKAEKKEKKEKKMRIWSYFRDTEGTYPVARTSPISAKAILSC